MNVKDPKTLVWVGLVGTVLVALCCFTPILVILLGVAGLSVLTGYLDYVLLPALAIFVGLILFMPYGANARLMPAVRPLTPEKTND